MQPLIITLLGILAAGTATWPFPTIWAPVSLFVAAIGAIAAWWHQRPFVKAVEQAHWTLQSNGDYQLAITKREHGKSAPKASVVGRRDGMYLGYRIGIEYEPDGTVLLVADPPEELIVTIV